MAKVLGGKEWKNVERDVTFKFPIIDELMEIRVFLQMRRQQVFDDVVAHLLKCE